MDYRVIHIGTSLQTRGGISAVLKIIFDDSEEQLSHIVTHCDGSVLKRITTFLSGWFALLRCLISGKRAIYHIHSASYGSWARKTICVLTIKPFGRPVVLHMHGAEFRKFCDRVGPVGRFCIRSVLRSTDAIVALSPEWAEFYQDLALRVPVVVIPNAVPIPRSLDKTHWQSDRRWRIICLGRLGERKGTYDLLQALTHVEDVELCLAGDGDIDRARALAQKLRVANRVELPGWIDAEARDALLSSAQIFALPSYAEGLPMALLEAMSYGLPIISTPVGGIPSLVENGVNGLLIDPGDIGALTQAIERLMSNPVEAERLGAAGRRTIKERYDAVVFRAALHKLHSELAAKYWRKTPRDLVQPKLS